MWTISVSLTFYIQNSQTEYYQCKNPPAPKKTNRLLTWHDFLLAVLWYACHLHNMTRADSKFAPSQWETALLCNDVSHWLGANLESALYDSSWCDNIVAFKWSCWLLMPWHFIWHSRISSNHHDYKGGSVHFRSAQRWFYLKGTLKIIICKVTFDMKLGA